MEKQEFKSHISAKYNRSLEDLFNHVLEMGGLVESQLKNAMESIKCDNKSLAKEVKQLDRVVNREEFEIDRIAANVLARQQPAASDLRLIVSAIRIGVDLERIGDESVNVARLAIKTAKDDAINCHILPGYDELMKMLAINIDMLQKVLAGFASLSLAEMADVLESDSIIADYRKTANEKIQKMLDSHESKNAAHVMQMISCIRAANRTSAHIVNVVESVVYIINGRNYKSIDSEKLAEFLNNID